VINTKTFGQLISEARKAKKMSQRDLAALIEKESGDRGISPAYLNDIEHDRRSPSDEFLVRQFADALGIDARYLLLIATKQLPEDLARRAQGSDAASYNKALLAFRKALDKK
jgi:transcriptional regulator with XRE-family HTH domain